MTVARYIALPLISRYHCLETPPTVIYREYTVLFIEPSENNFSEILIEIHTFLFKEMHLKILSRKWWPFCPGLNVLTLSELKW